MSSTKIAPWFSLSSHSPRRTIVDRLRRGNYWLETSSRYSSSTRHVLRNCHCEIDINNFADPLYRCRREWEKHRLPPLRLLSCNRVFRIGYRRGISDGSLLNSIFVISQYSVILSTVLKLLRGCPSGKNFSNFANFKSQIFQSIVIDIDWEFQLLLLFLLCETSIRYTFFKSFRVPLSCHFYEKCPSYY